MSLPLNHVPTIVSCVEHYVQTQPDERAYVFLEDGDSHELFLTYGELQTRAQQLATGLRNAGLKDQAILLLFPAGLDFVVAFFACLYAGAIAVPANLARNGHHYARLKQIIQDSNAKAVLTTESLKSMTMTGLSNAGISLESIRVLAEVEAASALIEANLVATINPSFPAFIQYTSGSTGNPKGVIVTHAQLIANERAIQASVDMPEFAIGGGWLPQFHDMGLIGAMLQPLAVGGCYIFMSPLHFIQSPLRWLRLLGKYKAVATAAPNFALEHCVKAAKAGSIEDIDLTALKTVFCGAEPVAQKTLSEFNGIFSACNLHPDTVKPCYGLAEATLILSGGIADRAPRYLSVDREQLKLNQLHIVEESSEHAKQVVCCGNAVKDHELVIVDPDTHHVLSDGSVGEIWAAGPSIAAGYWQNPRATLATFNGYTACGRGPFMRTGDMGFLREEGLFVTGRIKELMIIRGKNHYPHDIEETLIKSIAETLSIQAAVFADERSNAPGVAAFIELPRRGPKLDTTDLQELVGKLRSAVTQIHDLQLKDVFFLSFGGIPRTSSGKTQRLKCAEMHQNTVIDIDQRLVFSTRAARQAPAPLTSVAAMAV